MYAGPQECNEGHIAQGIKTKCTSQRNRSLLLSRMMAGRLTEQRCPHDTQGKHSSSGSMSKQVAAGAAAAAAAAAVIAA